MRKGSKPEHKLKSWTTSSCLRYWAGLVLRNSDLGRDQMDASFSKNRTFQRMIVNILSIVVILVMAFPVMGSVQAESLLSPWRDDFDGALGEGWYWTNENAGKWNLTENPGFLRIYAASGGAGSENLLLRTVAQGDFMIKTHLLFEPDTNFQFAGLVIWQDEYNFLQLGRAFCDIEGACVGNGLYFDHASGGEPVDGNFATSVGNPSDVFLRLERRGQMVRAFYSADEGISWYEIGTHWIPTDFQVNGVGLTASQDSFTPDWDIPADFDFFELTEGWGFLPEGFHDGEQGDVPNWACNAGGWAVDPDDRTTDVNVEIVVDDLTVTTLPAGDFRQDLADANVCEDGYCSFSTGLWDSISSYEPHNIDAWAQDTTSGEWVLLSNSDKTLTCRSYDIYAYDPLTETARLITKELPGTGEYDPTWSPNGKMVAHDVVSADSHEIYVTDVKTGVSTKLNGADGGNDASWSPNGKWIAFDRRWYDDPNIYVVPAAGGTRSLVRADAVSVSWAPNGKRIVFQDNNDGTIRTAPVDGGPGVETLIVDSGGTPSWSPDGNWIAYNRDGDIWKVRVNVQGTVLGEPIQLTSNPFNDGKPTWSPDSQTILYDSNFGQDSDLWSIPAAGGTPTWLSGAPVFGEYGPANARNSSTVAYAGFSPEVQAPRSWVVAFTYDLPGTWTEGTHTYHFEAAGLDNTPEISLEVGTDQRLYDGTVLLRPWSVVARSGEECSEVDALINPNQRTKFYVGWTAEGTYSDAQAYYENLMARVAWDGGAPIDLARHEIFPITSPVDWFGYTCNYTAGPPPARVTVQITDDWLRAENFTPNGQMSYWVYDAEGNLLTHPEQTWQLDGDGYRTVGTWEAEYIDLVPGYHLVVSDGVFTKEIVLEDLKFDAFNTASGQLLGRAPEPFGRDVWVGIGWENDGWSMNVPTDGWGSWLADFGKPVPNDYQWVAAQIFDPDGDASEVRPSNRTLAAGNFYVAWDQANPEEVAYLSWKGSGNLTRAWSSPYCPGDLEFFGNSWVSENEGDDSFFFASLVGWGTTGTWTGQAGTEVNIDSMSSGCPGSANFQIHTQYQFFEDELRANLMAVQRTFDFGADPYAHGIRPFIPRLNPLDGFAQVLHPDASGEALISDSTCGYGCTAASWDGTWFAIHNPATGQGVIVQRAASPYSVALWLDDDGGSFTNASSFVLQPPAEGFTGTVTETEYLCFYDSQTWLPSLTLPEGCSP